jgi:MFS family permease
MELPRYLIAFSSRNYRLYFAGQVISLIGTWMTQTTSLWLIYHLSNSAFLLGVVGFASMIPMFVIAPFAGVWIDRVNRHRFLIVTQILAMLQSMGLAAFALTNTINPSVLIAMSLLQGVINAFDLPARQAMVVEFIERKEHLGNAIALNSSMFNLARLIGPAIAGFVIAQFGAGICYLIDGISYVAVITCLWAMHFPPRNEGRTIQHPWIELREGFRYAFGFAHIRALILVVALVCFVGYSYTVLMPIFARDVFNGDARVLGYMMSAVGVGALIGAAYLGNRASVRGLGNVIAFGGGMMAAGLIGFSFSRWFPLSLICMTMTGLGGVLLMASSNTLVQTMVEDAKRGRVSSIFTMAFTGTTPLGNLMMGAIAGKIGAPTALAISGVVTAVVVLVFYLQLPKLRKDAAPVLEKLHIPIDEAVLSPVPNDEMNSE